LKIKKKNRHPFATIKNKNYFFSKKALAGQQKKYFLACFLRSAAGPQKKYLI
jgi:hypothetical protein